MTYEQDKQLAIQKALVADLEGKLSHINVELDTVKLEKTGYIEQLTVNESVYTAKIKKLYTEITAGNRRGVEALKIMKADEIKYNALQGNVSELNDRISKQDTVIQDLTSENQQVKEAYQRKNSELLKAEVEYLKRRNLALLRLEGVLKDFE